MKMLVIEIFNVGKGNKDFLRIASQPFIGDELYAGSMEFTATNGFRLASCDSPEVGSSCLYLRGRYKDKDNTILQIYNNNVWLAKLQDAVREYNSYLEDTGGAYKDELRGICKIQPNFSVLESLFDIEEIIA